MPTFFPLPADTLFYPTHWAKYDAVIAMYHGVYFTHNRAVYDIFHRTLIQSNADYFVRSHITAKDTGEKIPICEMIWNRLIKIQALIQVVPIGICEFACCGGTTY